MRTPIIANMESVALWRIVTWQITFVFSALFRTFRWRNLAFVPFLPPLVSLVEAEVEAAVFVEALVLAAPSVAFFVPMRRFFFLHVLSG